MDRRSVSRASPEALRRLASFIGVASRACDCDRCHARLAELVVRKLDAIERVEVTRKSRREVAA
jgi:hypothetical protein